MNSIIKTFACMGMALFAATIQAAPHFEDIVVSDSKGGDAVESFAPSTPMIYLRAHMADVANGSKIAASWIAVDTNGAAPANYKIDSVEFVAGALTNTIDTNLSKPNKGWPLGKYRVDLSVDGKVAGSALFSVEDEN
jgi:hypothetical protein